MGCTTGSYLEFVKIKNKCRSGEASQRKRVRMVSLHHSH